MIIRVAGIDEAGRGALAGPVVAAACILPSPCPLEGITDSKKLKEKERERLYEEIIAFPGVTWAVGMVDAEVIDQINILQATFLAMQRAVEALSDAPDALLIDGPLLPSISLPSLGIVGGDLHSRAIGAASILAKVTRDRWMRKQDSFWPEYSFAKHKGYGTAHHLAVLSRIGPSPLHRLSFDPLRCIQHA
ncbi:MAG: ribonuclease HII [Verrucomicrobiota bacterium]|nr:ribonuclease HII [Verrucomicrobiota bacterium]